MKTKFLMAAVVALSAAGSYAYAGDDDSKVTGLAGGAVTGAVIGGPVGAVVGGAVGLAAGAAIDDTKTNSVKTKTVIIKRQPDVVIQQENPDVIIDNR